MGLCRKNLHVESLSDVVFEPILPGESVLAVTHVLEAGSVERLSTLYVGWKMDVDVTSEDRDLYENIALIQMDEVFEADYVASLGVRLQLVKLGL